MDATKAITEEIRVYFLNTFEILEMMRKMVFRVRLDMNILIRDEGDINKKSIINQRVMTYILLITIDYTREEMRRVDQEYAIGIAIIVILVCLTCYMSHVTSSDLCLRSASPR